MYHIHKTKSKKFQVVLTGKNGEVLSTSEVLNSKQKCFTNARAQLNSGFISLASHLWPGVFVQDDTLEDPIVFIVRSNGKSEKHIVDPEPKYVPGVNPKKKK